MNDKEKKLYNAITNIDDEIISESESFYRPPKRIWQYLPACAACLVLALTALLVTKNLVPPPNAAASPSQTETDFTENAISLQTQSFSQSQPENTDPSQSTASPYQTETEFTENTLPLQTQSSSQSQHENTDADLNWQTPDEILDNEGIIPTGIPISNLWIPTFVAYKGGFYGSFYYEFSLDENIRLAAVTDLYTASYLEYYPYTVYLVENRPDCIALLINGYFQMYQKQFDVIFEYEGKTYGIAYPSVHPDDCKLGDTLLQNEELTLYSATFSPGEPGEESQLIVDILPMLRSKGYEIFKEEYDENGEPIHYTDAWWVVKPLD